MEKYLPILLLLFGSNYIKAQPSETDSVAEIPARAYFNAGQWYMSKSSPGTANMQGEIKILW